MASQTNQPYIHGGAPQHALKRLGIDQEKIVDFSVNVNPMGPPRAIYQNWHKLSGVIESYPSVNGDGVADYYMQRFGLKRENILPGNGSTECLYLAPRVLGLKKVAIVTPSFHDYERATLMAGADFIELPLKADDNFAEPDVAEYKSLLTSVDALMMGNPNNPTGTLFSTQTLLDLAALYPDKWFLIDEAFLQFLDDFRERTLIAPERLRKNIIIFHSLTKLYDIPGIRLGAAIGHPETISLLKAHKEPWSVNGIAEKIAGLLVNTEDYEERLKSLVTKEQQRLVMAFNHLKGMSLYPSPVNFMLARWEISENLDDLLRFLLANGVHVRDCRNFRHLENNFFRFAILKPADNKLLIDLLTKATNRVFA